MRNQNKFDQQTSGEAARGFAHYEVVKTDNAARAFVSSYAKQYPTSYERMMLEDAAGEMGDTVVSMSQTAVSTEASGQDFDLAA